MSNQLRFRELSDDDYDDVVSIIPDAWDGKDYLADKYYDYTADPDCTCFGAETPIGQLVGFHAAFLVDDGERMLRIGGRVKASLQGQGVFQSLLRHMYLYYSNNPKLQWESIVLIEPHAQKLKRQYTDLHGYREVLIKKRYLYRFEFPWNVWNHPSSLVEELTGDDLEILFSCEDTCQRLFPNNRIFLHCKPFGTLPANIRHFTHKNNIILATSTNNEGYHDGSQRHQFLESVNLFSIGDYYYQKSGLHYNIELYGDDMTSFPLHLQRHLQHLESFRTPIVELFVHTDENIDVNSVDLALSPYGVKRDLTYVDTICLFERPFYKATKEASEESL